MFRTSSQVLPGKVQHPAVGYVFRQAVEQQVMVDGGIVGPNIGLQDEAVLRKMPEHLADGPFAATDLDLTYVGSEAALKTLIAKKLG